MSHRPHQKRCPKCGLRVKDVVKHLLHDHVNAVRSLRLSPSRMPDVVKSAPASPPMPDWRNPQPAGSSRRFGIINVYTCETCGHRTITRDVHEGTTWFINGCTAPGCNGDARSNMYAWSNQRLADEVTHEWRFPTEEEFKVLDPALQEHVERGGLLIYQLTPAVPR